MSGPPDDSGKKNPLQQIKSTITYLEIATFEAVTGIAASDAGDDDGNGTARKGMPIEQYNEFAKRIQEQTTKERAKAAYTEAVKVCVTFQDVGSAELLKAILVQHGEFIDRANTASAK